VWYGAREVAAYGLAVGDKSLAHFDMPNERLWIKNGRIGRPTFSVGAGDFDLWGDVQLNPVHPTLPFYWTSSALLTTLFVMHIIWYSLFWRILYRMVFVSMHEAGQETYEGDSDDEDEPKKD